jgi:hypothetical protein
VPTLADRGCRVVSATDPHGRNLGFLDPEPLLFHSSSSSIVLTRPSGFRIKACIVTDSFMSLVRRSPPLILRQKYPVIQNKCKN